MDLVKAALRRVARERPDVPEVLVRDLVLGAVDPTAVLELEQPGPGLAGDPAVSPDFLARVGMGELLHVEFRATRMPVSSSGCSASTWPSPCTPPSAP
jgi:hypothetical protein